MGITLSRLKEKNNISLIEKSLSKPKNGKIFTDKTYMPLGLDMNGISCLVVGGGRIALRKIKALLKSGASVIVVSPQVVQEIASMANEGNLRWVQDRYNSSYLFDCDIVISATSDRKLNITIGKEAKSAGKLHCVTSSAKDSSLIFPAVYNHNDTIVAVHSNGRNCIKSKYTRNNIANILSKKQADKLLMIGVYYMNISSQTANALDTIAKKYANKIYKDKILFITTCQRWECYICSSNPEQIFREVTEIAEQSFDIRFTDFSQYLYSKEDAAVFHHLIRLYTGLDSMLLGENDIRRQITSATKNWLSDESPLKSIFNVATNKSKIIRKSSHLSTANKAWQSLIVEFIKSKLGGESDKGISVLGNGKFAKSILYCLKDEFKNVFDSSDENYAKIVMFCDDNSFSEFDFDGMKDKDTIILNFSRHSLPQLSKNGFKIFDLKDIADLSIGVEKAIKKAKAELLSIEQSLIWHSATSEILTPKEQITIGARDSLLSRLQVQEILHLISAFCPTVEPCVKFYGTPGDRDKTTPLPQILQEDFFTQDIDAALMAYEIDFAIHSAKDLPQQLNRNMHIAAITPSLAPWDCLVSRSGINLASLPANSKIGTSSPRRAKQILRLRDDVEIVDIRGNIPDRLAQLDSGKYDAIVVASVAMIRLGLAERIAEIFPLSAFDVEQNQGSLALITRKSDIALTQFLRPLDLGRRSNL